MDIQHIQVYTDAKTKRRIELAALKYDMPVTAYCLDAIRRQLADEALLEADSIVIDVAPGTQSESVLSEMRTLRDRIAADRGGKPLEIDIRERVREERDHEIIGLH